MFDDPTFRKAKIAGDIEQARQRWIARQTPTGIFRRVHVLKRIWTPEECEVILNEVLRFVEGEKGQRKCHAVDEEEEGYHSPHPPVPCPAAGDDGWMTSRHRSFSTTDLEAFKVRRIFGWLQESLRERLLPKIAALYGIPDEVRETPGQPCHQPIHPSHETF